MLSNTKKTTIYFLIVVFLLFGDRILKNLALANFFSPEIHLFKNFFKLNFATNQGIAFSIPLSGVWLNFLVGSLILILIINLGKTLKQKKTSEAFFLSLTIAGATSNLFDRLQYGFVIDYLDLQYFTIFNLADVMIVGGVLGMVYFSFKKT